MISCETKSSGCLCHKTLGILVILFGLVGILAVLGRVSRRAALLSFGILIILGGIKMLATGFCRCSDKNRIDTPPNTTTV